MGHWFEGPFPLVSTPFAALPKGEKEDECSETATEMALAHNVLVRGLNSIYHQAPYVKPEDQDSFVGYAKNFVNVLKVHHDCEEESFFIKVEQMSGEAGVMEKNVEQHHAFHDGLEELQRYLIELSEGAKTYDGKRILAIIDGFGTLLAEHLKEEVQCLVELKRFGPEKMKGLVEILRAEGAANLKKIGLAGGAVYALLGHDATWENGIWADFPPTPPGLKTVVMKGLYYWHASWWRFSPCDNNFMPKPKPYAGSE